MENLTELQGLCIQVFNEVSRITIVFVLPLMMAKIVFSQALGEGHKALDAIKGAVVYFVLIAAFPMVLELLFAIPEAFLPKELPRFEGVLSMGFGSIPFSLDQLLEVVLSFLYWVAYYLHVFFMLLMCSMAPVVFLFSSLLGVGLGIEVFMGLLVIGSSWPIIWMGFDKAHAVLSVSQNDDFGRKCLELILTIFKGISPLAFAAMAIKSPAGKAISSAAKGMAMGAKVSLGAGKVAGVQVLKPVIRVAKDRLKARKKNSSSGRLNGPNRSHREHSFSKDSVYESTRTRNFKT